MSYKILLRLLSPDMTYGYESRKDILDYLMNGNIPHVALKYDKDARVFSLPYREADITDAQKERL